MEYCEPSKCLEREGYYFKLLNPEYNTSSNPSAPMSGRTHSDESRKKISDATQGDNHRMFGQKHSEETRKKISEARSGKTLSESIRKKISEAKLGKTLSEETRKKISDKGETKTRRIRESL